MAKQKSELKVGDVVYLKSGSPRMTICEITGAHAHVRWCVYGTNEFMSAETPLVTLTLAHTRSAKNLARVHDENVE